jgi:PAS domain S-box-containing protein
MRSDASTVMVDLHCHSDASDGYYEPHIVADLLAEAGVDYAALTDHQTTAGASNFRATASRRGIADIVGAEIAARIEETEIHLLAYGFDPESPIMQGLFGRVVSAAEAIAAIHEAEGIAFLAHPFQMGLQGGDLEDLLKALVARGLDGLEAFYKPYTDEQQEELVALADQLGILTSAGSDFHGPREAASQTPGVPMPVGRWKAFRHALGDHIRNGGRAGEVPPPTKRRRFIPFRETAAEINWRWLALRIIAPSLLVITFFVILLFAVLIPTMEERLLDRKRETTSELTNSAWSILADYERAVREGSLTLEEAQSAAIERIRRLRYGPEGLDYFWITDMHPRMVMHPYREELEGTDLTGFTDPDGIRPFVEFVEEVRRRSSGYVRYVWQWQDDPQRLEPKESYVREFAPWGWIIGTGLYVQDVEQEIEAITGRMIDASFIVTLIAGVLLLTVAHQSLKVERKRGEAERELRISHERYRLLAEASAGGTLLLVDGRCTYANRTLLEMLRYSAEELAFLDIHDIILVEEDSPEAQYLAAILEGEEVHEPFEIHLKPRDGRPAPALLSATSVFFSGREGLILSVQDIKHHEAMRAALGASRAKYEVLAQNISSGVFRLAIDHDVAFVEMNPAARRIFGLSEADDLPSSFSAFTADDDTYELFVDKIRSESAVRDMTMQLRRADGRIATVRLSAVRSEVPDSAVPVCDAIMEDISERNRSEAERDSLISQLQTSLLFLTEPIRNAMKPPVTCPLDSTIAQAARLMSRKNVGALVVVGPAGEQVGIITDHDIRQRVVVAELDPQLPVSRVMSAPVVSINENAPVFEAFLIEREREVDHLTVTDSGDNLVGVIRASRTIRLDRYSPVVLLQQVRTARTLEDMAESLERLPTLAGSLVESGAVAQNICHVTSAVSDAAGERVIAIAMEQLGPPPVPYAFVALGSEARQEQTLVTDQDNALVYADPPEEMAGRARDYFLELGEFVCAGLDQVGYPYCEGGAMARDPRWNRPFSDWREYFAGWISEPDGSALAHCNVFFDIRPIYGERGLVHTLWNHVDRLLERHPAFFSHMALNTLQYKPPIGLFGQIVTGSTGGSPKTFNIKEAMVPIVNFARLYALKHHLEETNTFDRLEQLHALGVLQEDSFRGLFQAYGHLMRLRYRHQVDAIKAGEPADNSIDPRSLSEIDMGVLKNTLSRITVIQKKVSFEFRSA